LPADVACGAFGPRLRAAIATLAVRNHVSRRDTTELLGELFGADISTGTVDAIVRRVGGALAEPYGDLLDHVRDANAVNIDETARSPPASPTCSCTTGSTRGWSGTSRPSRSSATRTMR
jgi:hypothetical protein